MAITFRASASAGNSTGSLTITKPTGTVEGDVMIAGIAAAGAPTFTAPTGWTSLRRDVSGIALALQSYRKVAGPSEPADYTWTLSVANPNSGAIVSLDGGEPSNDNGTAVGQANAASVSVTAPSVTPAVSNTMTVGFFASNSNSTYTADANMTEREDRTSNAACSLEATTEPRVDTTATGTRVATATVSAVNIGQQVNQAPEVDPVNVVAILMATIPTPADMMTRKQEPVPC